MTYIFVEQSCKFIYDYIRLNASFNYYSFEQMIIVVINNWSY